MTDQAPELLPKIEVTELHKQSAAGFLCWPMNIIDLCKSDADLPRAVDALAKFIARWERKGAEATRPPSERPVAREVKTLIAKLRARAIDLRMRDINAVGEANVGPIQGFFDWQVAGELERLAALTAERPEAGRQTMTSAPGDDGGL